MKNFLLQCDFYYVDLNSSIFLNFIENFEFKNMIIFIAKKK